MRRKPHEQGGRAFIGTAKRTGKAAKGLASGPNGSPLMPGTSSMIPRPSSPVSDFGLGSWGLRPRLYADTCSAGLKGIDSSAIALIPKSLPILIRTNKRLHHLSRLIVTGLIQFIQPEVEAGEICVW